jgi:hypothetical protein
MTDYQRLKFLKVVVENTANKMKCVKAKDDVNFLFYFIEAKIKEMEDSDG